MTGDPPPLGVAEPVFAHVSIASRTPVAAALCVLGYGNENSPAKPTGPGGGVATNAGAIPPPTVTPKAAKAASMGAAAAPELNADTSAVCSVAAAAETVVDAGTTAAAELARALAQSAAHSATVAEGLDANASRSVFSPGPSSGIRSPGLAWGSVPWR